MEVRKIKKEEYDILVAFLRKYWKSNHSLVKSKLLLDYQHLDGNQYNFYAAIEDGEIYAIEGFIRTSKYDKSLIGRDDLWGVIWKTRPDAPKGELGLAVTELLEEDEDVCSMGGIGLTPIAKKINKIKGDTIGYLHHYYIANNSVGDYSIGDNLEIEGIELHQKSKGWSIKQDLRLDEISEPLHTYRPYKTREYLINKYQYHPIYKYVFWGVYHNEKLVSIWVVRRITVRESSIIRIVDVLGRLDDIPDLFINLQQILFTESCEYIDFLNYGINQNVLRRIGFKELDFDSNTIVPSYFEPFEKRNVRIDLSFKAQYEEYVVFKGDADQDRPSIL